MDNTKRPFGAYKSSVNRNILKKMEEVALMLSASRAGDEEDGEANTMQYPIVQQADLATALPKYTSILSRSPTNGVAMADLDPLQLELEQLLSSCAVRQRALRADVESFDKVDEKKERGKSMKKRKVAEDKPPRHKNSRNIGRSIKVKQIISTGPPVLNPESTVVAPVETVQPLLKHDVSDRFWLSVDSYCQDVTKDNLVFLDDLIKECAQEIDMKIPALGEHYATEWSEHGIQDEQTNGCILVDSLLEEKAMASLLFTTVLDKYKSADYIKGVHGIRNGLCLEKRLRREGILDVDDFSKSLAREDEILQEIRRCQQELVAVNLHNATELGKLREVVGRDLRKQDVKAALEKVDRDILAMSQKVQLAREKQQDLSLFQQEANDLIKQQAALNAELLNFNSELLK